MYSISPAASDIYRRWFRSRNKLDKTPVDRECLIKPDFVHLTQDMAVCQQGGLHFCTTTTPAKISLMANNKPISMILLLLLPLALCAQTKRSFSVSGIIKDKRSGETLSGASIGFSDHPGLGVVTNAYGFYSITIPEGHYSMVVSFSGYGTDTIPIDLAQNTVLNRSLSAGGSQMQEVVVSGRKANNILKTPPGVQRLAIQDIKDLPVLLGEKDVLKTIQLLPGVKSAGDGKSGFFVRGGGIDQNLILLDEATVYNPSHLLGF